VSLPLRARTGAAVVRAVNAASRRLGVGGGTVIGGRAGLAIDPDLLQRLAAGRQTALVSGTNGKTTTTRLLAVALGEGGGSVVTNATGSNMPAGHVAALAAGPPGSPVVLEVDEGYVPALVQAVAPAAVVLLNLSRDQLDRTNEVRMQAGRWRAALAGVAATVVANVDDPLVVWGAGEAHRVVWVAAGLGWWLDAVGCPACEGRIVFAGADGSDGAEARAGWRCGCGFARPVPDVEVVEGPAGRCEAVWADGRRMTVSLGIPGRFNRGNAVMAAAAAEALGVPAERALGAMAAVGEVGGRFTVRRIGGVDTRLMLAKNPAGWHELLDLVCPGDGPVVVGINARVADGRDPSWLWDVPFERLRGRTVVATGERCLDLAVRLRYAEVPHRTVRDPRAAVALAGRSPAGPADSGRGNGSSGAFQGDAARHDAEGAPRTEVEFVGNYTAFFDLLEGR
jgi:lipid II isoglutaminyl synthase (glutamine-hydrolysing)